VTYPSGVRLITYEALGAVASWRIRQGTTSCVLSGAMSGHPFCLVTEAVAHGFEARDWARAERGTVLEFAQEYLLAASCELRAIVRSSIIQ